MKQSTKDAIGFCLLAAAIMGVFATCLYKTIERNEYIRKVEARIIQDCKELNPKYGEFFLPIAGPYSETEMMAVRFNVTSVGVIPLIGFQGEPLFFGCADLKRVTKESK